MDATERTREYLKSEGMSLDTFFRFVTSVREDFPEWFIEKKPLPVLAENLGISYRTAEKYLAVFRKGMELPYLAEAYKKHRGWE